MKYDCRLSLDTLYFGLQIDGLDFKWAYPEIKNFLSFKVDENFNRSRSKFYQCEAVNEDEGFYLFFSPHKNLKNDYCTFQFTGKFFREITHLEILKNIMDFFEGFINYQRVDVCLDVMYLEFPLEYDFETNNYGFPMPRYSDNWNNVKLPFDIYCRLNKSDDKMFVNMVRVGKGDLVLRVYDKSLEILEKQKMTYSEYYGYTEEYLNVFRIEYQMRGRSLKEFVDNCCNLGINLFDIECLEGAVMSCLFNKFNFKYLDDCAIDPVYIPTSSHRVSTLEGRIRFHKQKSGFHYFKWVDCVEQAREIEKENKQVKNILKDSVKDDLKVFKTVFDFDLEEASRREYQDIVKDIPF